MRKPTNVIAATCAVVCIVKLAKSYLDDQFTRWKGKNFLEWEKIFNPFERITKMGIGAADIHSLHIDMLIDKYFKAQTKKLSLRYLKLLEEYINKLEEDIL